MSDEKKLLSEREIKRFAKLSGVEVTPELLKEAFPVAAAAAPAAKALGVGLAALPVAVGGATAYNQSKEEEAEEAESVAAGERETLRRTGDPRYDLKARQALEARGGTYVPSWAQQRPTHGPPVPAELDPGRGFFAPPSPGPAVEPTPELDDMRRPDPTGKLRDAPLQRMETTPTETTPTRRGGRRGGRRRGRGRATTNQALTDAGIASYDDFYAGLRQRGLTHLLGRTGEDRRFGPAHRAALAALQAAGQAETTGQTERAPGDRGWDAPLDPGMARGTPDDPHLTQTDVERMAAGRAPTQAAFDQGISGSWQAGRWVADSPQVQAKIDAQRATWSDAPLRRRRAAGLERARQNRVQRDILPISTANMSDSGDTAYDYAFMAQNMNAADRELLARAMPGVADAGNEILRQRGLLENKGFSSQEEELIQTLTERILIKYFNK